MTGFEDDLFLCDSWREPLDAAVRVALHTRAADGSRVSASYLVGDVMLLASDHFGAHLRRVADAAADRLWDQLLDHAVSGDLLTQVSPRPVRHWVGRGIVSL